MTKSNTTITWSCPVCKNVIDPESYWEAAGDDGKVYICHDNGMCCYDPDEHRRNVGKKKSDKRFKLIITLLSAMATYAVYVVFTVGA